MNSLLNCTRPTVFCPECSHDRIVRALEQAMVGMNLSGEDVVIATDIGCSGLLDTHYNTHAFHGLHGRALTDATGINLARPDTTVVVTMGDGGIAPRAAIPW
jgi:pyruvate/2-oxoacid:ferredoxin oxidoreductase beta subunit